MTEDNYKCKVCGEKFEENEDLTSHGKDNHPVFTESYAKEDYEDYNEREWDADDGNKSALKSSYTSGGDQFIDQGQDPIDNTSQNPMGEAEEEATFGDYEVKCDCDKDPNCQKCGSKGSNTWTSTVYQGDEIEQQQDKPVQSHDDCQKE